MPESLVAWGIIALALSFDFVNGFHDAANSIATVVSTRVLRPFQAVAWAAFFNFIAFLIFETHVASTIGRGVVQPDAITLPVVTAGLIGAIVWDLLTWWAGLPTSSSHALVAGFAGAALSSAGSEGLVVWGLVKIGLFILVAPLMGMAIGWLIMVATYWAFRRSSPTRVSTLFRRLQLVSAACYSLGHGGNDAQKTMGQRICHLQPVHGFAAESGGALCLYGATWMGIPVSTTHTITGAIVGVGSTRGLKAVRWGVAGRVVWAWVLTIPAAAIVSAGAWHVFALIGWH